MSIPEMQGYIAFYQYHKLLFSSLTFRPHKRQTINPFKIYFYDILSNFISYQITCFDTLQSSKKEMDEKINIPYANIFICWITIKWLGKKNRHKYFLSLFANKCKMRFYICRKGFICCIERETSTEFRKLCRPWK